MTSPIRSWGKLVWGEVYDAKPDLLQSYVDTGMKVTDYNLYDAVQAAFRFGGSLRRLEGSGFAARNGSESMTFIENHDVGAPQNRRLAQAFLAAYAGYPIFYDVKLDDKDLSNLVWIRKNFASGHVISRLSEDDVSIIERDGKLIAAVNQSGSWQSRWISTNFWGGTKLHDYSGHVGDVWVQNDGRVEVSIPPMDYVMLAP